MNGTLKAVAAILLASVPARGFDVPDIGAAVEVALPCSLAADGLLDLQGGNFTESLYRRLLQSPRGTRLIQELRQELSGHWFGTRITVEPFNFPNTAIVVRNDRQTLRGTRASVVVSRRAVRYNAALARMDDREAALNMGAASLAHELHHVLWRLRAERTLASYDDVWALDFVDEQHARVVGLMVAVELGGDIVNDQTEEAVRLAGDPDRFWELVSSGTYPHLLRREDFRDPRGVYGSRIQALERNIRDLENEAVRNSGRALILPHFEREHPELAGRLTALREDLTADLRDIPLSISRIEALILSTSENAARLNQGRMFRLSRAPADRGYGELERAFQADQARLVELVRRRPPAVQEARSNQLTWAQLSRLYERDSSNGGEHFEYWRGQRTQAYQLLLSEAPPRPRFPSFLD